MIGIPEDAIMATNQTKLHLGLTARQMAELYNAFDVLVNPSYGEGFGIPIVEAQACGTPVIVTDWTSMPELCGAGWLVDGDPWYDTHHGSFFKCPSLVDLHNALEQAYADAAGMRDRARAFAVQYDADRVTAEFWAPALAELERMVEPARLVEIPAEAPPNRAARRAAARAKVAA
jgi:glycosyltransferase involved in cell wall biosynthesis